MGDRCPFVLDRSGRDVQAEAALLRARGPVALVELPGGVLAWSVNDFEVVRAVLGDPRFAKDPRRAWPRFIDGGIPREWPMITWVVMDNMVTRDGADHERLRSVVSRGFTPRRIASARPMIERVTRGLLEEMAALPAGAVVDLKECFAYRLPATVVCELFGVPQADRAAALKGGEVNVRTTISGEEAAANVEQWHGAMAALIAARHREPGDDVTSLLITEGEGGTGRLNDEEMAGTLHLMLGAGSETLMNVLSHAVLNLLTHPDQLDLVLSGRVGWDAVVEETLRVESPVAQLPFRFATEDVAIGGVTIARGDPVLLGFAAAGRDPKVHGESADRFDVTRPDKSHLSFGHGEHYCLGAPLARLEASVALPALFDRFPHISLAVRPDQLQPQGTFIMNGHLELPVRLTTPAPEPAPVPANA